MPRGPPALMLLLLPPLPALLLVLLVLSPSLLVTRGAASSATARTFTEHQIADVVAPLREANAVDRFDSTYLLPLLVPRPVGSAEHKRVADWIGSRLRQSGWQVSEDAFDEATPRGTMRFRNIVAVMNPHAPRRVVLAAHYDSKIFDDFGFVGATDSAGPCAVLLQLAEVLGPRLKRQDRKHTTTLELVFFDGEEAMREWTRTDSLYGSRHLAATLAQQASAGKAANALADIDVLILLDLLGTRGARVYNLYEQTAPLYRRMERIEARLNRLKLLLAEASPRQPMLASVDGQVPRPAPQIDDDHRPFLERGVPVVHLIPIPFPAEWHTRDDVGAVLDRRVLLDWAQVLAVFVCEYLDI